MTKTMATTTRSAAKATPNSQRVKAYEKGRQAEYIAAEILCKKGFRILSRRYRTCAGELDIVAANEDHLSFVEVKARRSLDEASWSITPRQQRRIADAAGLWLQEFPDYLQYDMTFDAVLVAPGRQPHYISDAFRL
jgi:putative endonuclease